MWQCLNLQIYYEGLFTQFFFSQIFEAWGNVTKQEILTEKIRHRNLNGETKEWLTSINLSTFSVDMYIRDRAFKIAFSKYGYHFMLGKHH